MDLESTNNSRILKDFGNFKVDFGVYQQWILLEIFEEHKDIHNFSNEDFLRLLIGFVGKNLENTRGGF